MFFEKAGPQNTDHAIGLAVKRANELNIKNISKYTNQKKWLIKYDYVQQVKTKGC